MRVLLVDDHAVVRRGVEQIIRDEYADVEIGHAAAAAEAIEQAARGTWSLIVLDLSMPGRGGLDLLKELKARWPTTPVLVLSMHEERDAAVRTLRAGASGYLTKASAPDQLPRAIRVITSGGTFVTAAVEELADERGTPSHRDLSDRELQTLQMIGQGMTVKQIAIALSLSEKTVSTYRTRLLDKLRLHTTAELIRYALENRLA
jgi:two-component system, NarL family, invasion response regulator UvrY